MGLDWVLGCARPEGVSEDVWTGFVDEFIRLTDQRTETCSEPTDDDYRLWDRLQGYQCLPGSNIYDIAGVPRMHSTLESVQFRSMVEMLDPPLSTEQAGDLTRRLRSLHAFWTGDMANVPRGGTLYEFMSPALQTLHFNTVRPTSFVTDILVQKLGYDRYKSYTSAGLLKMGRELKENSGGDSWVILMADWAIYWGDRGVFMYISV